MEFTSGSEYVILCGKDEAAYFGETMCGVVLKFISYDREKKLFVFKDNSNITPIPANFMAKITMVKIS